MEFETKSVFSSNQRAFQRALVARPDGWRFSGAQSSDELYDAVADLPDSDYAQVTLRYLDGLSLAQLSEEYGLKRSHLELLLRLAADTIAGSTGSESEAEVPEPAIVPTHVDREPAETVATWVYSSVTPHYDGREPSQEPEYTAANFTQVAGCRSNPELFFAKTKAERDAAKKECGKCAVKAICLEVALENDKTLSDDERKVSGIWAGLTPQERKKLLPKRT